LIGVNGSGKSTVLDALAILLSQYAEHLRARFDKRSRPYWPSYSKFAFTEVDVYSNASEASLAIIVETANDKQWSWSIQKGNQPNFNDKFQTNRSGQLADSAQTMLNQSAEVSAISFPILA
jgi:predicted ATP-binding protein involved in virulence